MEKSLFEQMGGTYTMQGDYCLPNLRLPQEDSRPIGVWGQRRLCFLKRHHRGLYYNLLTSGKLHDHLADTEERAQAMFLRLVAQHARQEGLTEQLKAEKPMEWVWRMNGVEERITEVINTETIVARC